LNTHPLIELHEKSLKGSMNHASTQRRCARMWCVAALITVVVLSADVTNTRADDVDSFRDAIERINDLVITHRYREAEKVVLELERANLDSASVQLQKAVLYYTWIDDYGIADSLGAEFLTAVERTVALSEDVLAHEPNNAYVRFYRGSALAYRALFRSYVDGIGIRTIPSLLRDATGGIKELERARECNPNFNDPLIGIAQYRYWTSHSLPWPFSSEKDAREGVRLIEQALADGVDWGAVAVQTLGWMYIRERRYEDAIELVAPMIDRYPNGRNFREIAARAHLSLRDLDTAETMYRQIIDGLNPAERASNFMVMKYERWLTRIDAKRGDLDDACERARRLQALDYTGVHRTWLREKTPLYEQLLRGACKQTERASDSE